MISTRKRWDDLERERVLVAVKDAVVIWDFDGVIADTEPLHEESYRVILKRLGYTPPEDFYLEFTGRSDKYIWERFTEMGVPLDGDADAFEKEKCEVFPRVVDAERDLQSTWLVSDLAEDVSFLASRQVILSNGDINVIIALIARWGLGDKLEVIQRPNEWKKKELLVGFLDQYKCVVLEDNAETLALATSKGAFCVGVTHPMFSKVPLIADIIVPIRF